MLQTLFPEGPPPQGYPKHVGSMGEKGAYAWRAPILVNASEEVRSPEAGSPCLPLAASDFQPPRSSALFG